MPSHVLRRAFWSGKPEQQDDLFYACKGALTARCEVWTHEFGVECRLYAGEEWIASQVCRSQDEIRAFEVKWRAALAEKGWT